jgi:YidC/Oxa1 family membrane protein insertase
MFNFIGDIFNFLVIFPLTNILYALELLTKDTGWALIIMAFIVNFALLPWNIKAYVNGQKMKYLQPEFEAIREKYKDDPKQMLSENGKLNKKHNIDNGSTFFTIIIQVVVLIALFNIVNNIVGGKQLEHIYSFLSSDGKTNFSGNLFNTWSAKNATNQQLIWMPILVAILVYLQGLFSFKLIPPPKIPLPIKKIKKDADPTKPDFSESLVKMTEFQALYFLPAFYLLFNLNLPIGLNVYYIGSSFFNLLRQIIVLQYYHLHSERLLQSIVDSDPELQRRIKHGDMLIEEPIVVDNQVIDVSSKPKHFKSPITKKGKFKKKKK